MARCILMVEIEYEHESGRFVARDQLIEAIIEAVRSGAEDAYLGGLDEAGSAEYTVTGVLVEEAPLVIKDNDRRPKRR